MKIIIPGTPISVNQLYRGRRFLTKQGEQIKYEYQCEAYNQYKGKPIVGPVEVIVEVFFNDKRKHDLDNTLKALFDSFTGILWKDDGQIVKITAMKKVGKPCIKLYAWKFE